jgi:cbb3-type cytochrome oxidase subunit 3
MNMDINLIRIAVTVTSFVSFLLIVGWVLHKANNERFARAARAPLEEGDER